MENSALTGGLSVWSEGGGRGRVWQNDLPVKMEKTVCFEPHLKVDIEVEPKAVAIQETGQT